MKEDGSPKIYLLPNLMTAGNLFCGFAATLRIVEGALLQEKGGDPIELYHTAIWFILGACIFDLLDGRVARMGGNESPFGREFDSLADIVSFGVAPALLIYRIVLQESYRFGWLIAFLYLVCGALRLARFNCIAAANIPGGDKEFKGFPIPAAAGLIASLTLCMLWWEAGEHPRVGYARFVLPPLMIFLAFMMFSRFRYPSFKAVNWRTKNSIPRFIVIIGLIVFTAMNYEWMPAVIFIAYLIYGFVRPWISRKWQREIEEEDEDEADAPEAP
ncbi:MAG: CDP-diacylglycerol---serine O-phosphatidyltransferase [Chthoniobacter sp.]|jgi:CDP-diacylglycerol--serine O-phosphatidyltransferase|nr:CDP-diacylglycerol---serine O-phosphatidyltransferase [Chthoniobacter sp.]